jgi:hypothetical protein
MTAAAVKALLRLTAYRHLSRYQRFLRWQR